jgi:hypothetical protein
MRLLWGRNSKYNSFVVKGPAADATDAQQLWGLLCNAVMEISFFVFPCHGAPVEWNWQGQTEVLGEKTGPSATLSIINPIWTDLGSNPGFAARGWRLTAWAMARPNVHLGLWMCGREWERAGLTTVVPYNTKAAWRHSLWSDRKGCQEIKMWACQPAPALCRTHLKPSDLEYRFFLPSKATDAARPLIVGRLKLHWHGQAW